MNNVKLFASAGLVVVVIAHALVLGLVLSSNQANIVRQSQPLTVPMQYQQPADYPQMSGPTNQLNTSALHENKQGIGDGYTRVYNPNTGEHVPVPNQFVTQKTPESITRSILENKTQGARSQAGPCFPCEQQPYYAQPSYSQPNYVAPYSYSQPYTPAPAPVPQVPLALTKPANKPNKLALFLNGSAKSQEVLQWFSRNPELRNLRNNCDFQLYSPGDTLYRARYARIVPVEAMPAVIWMNQSPGDIEGKQAALVAGLGGSDITTEWQLVHDLKQGYAMLLDVQRSAASAAQPYVNMYQVPRLTDSQFWNQFAAPTLVLNQASFGDELGSNAPPCVGPNCPNNQPLLQPDDGRDWRHPFGGDKNPVNGPLVDLARQPQEALIAIALVCVGAVIALGILAFGYLATRKAP